MTGKKEEERESREQRPREGALGSPRGSG